MQNTTIAAIATAPGAGGIAVVRLSGPESYAVAARVFHPANPNKNVEEAGYSVAVGTASHSVGGIDIDALVKKAEQRMYLDKSRHYEQLRRGTEE